MIDPDINRERVAACLSAARARIAPWPGWTIGAVARDENGHTTAAGSPMARQWCALGALDAERSAFVEAVYLAANDLLQHLACKLHGLTVAQLNDRGGPEAHAAVLALYDAAIEQVTP